jgi:hypothetical protein
MQSGMGAARPGTQLLTNHTPLSDEAKQSDGPEQQNPAQAGFRRCLCFCRFAQSDATAGAADFFSTAIDHVIGIAINVRK